MPLQTVTITGADNSVSPEEIITISQRYPSVEWGILLSATQEGSPRFPSRSWMRKFSDQVQSHALQDRVHTSAHLCGRWLRDLLQGDITCPHLDLGIFDRIQLNFHAEKQEVNHEKFADALQQLSASGRKIIFQWDGVNSYILEGAIKRAVDAQALFDLSHGAGILPATWPSPLKGMHCGYAGGLRPENLYEQLAKIDKAAGDNPYWVDMETGVRSHGGEIFDIDKVWQCLRIASDFMRSKRSTN